VERVVIIASASGSGKTTLARELAHRLGAEHIELDALVHQAGWEERPDADLRALLADKLVAARWVVDGMYRRKLGTMVLDAADTVVWLDLPRRVWLPRLVRRTLRRMITQEELWNGNRESLRAAVWGRDALLPYAWRAYPRNRRELPETLAPYRTIRLRTPAEVTAFLDRA
jgi:adenylate kinase family enzyme